MSASPVPGTGLGPLDPFFTGFTLQPLDMVGTVPPQRGGSQRSEERCQGHGGRVWVTEAADFPWGCWGQAGQAEWQGGNQDDRGEYLPWAWLYRGHSAR